MKSSSMPSEPQVLQLPSSWLSQPQSWHFQPPSSAALPWSPPWMMKSQILLLPAAASSNSPGSSPDHGRPAWDCCWSLWSTSPHSAGALWMVRFVCKALNYLHTHSTRKKHNQLHHQSTANIRQYKKPSTSNTHKQQQSQQPMNLQRVNLEPNNYPNLKPTITPKYKPQEIKKTIIQPNHNKTHAQHNTPWPQQSSKGETCNN